MKKKIANMSRKTEKNMDYKQIKKDLVMTEVVSENYFFLHNNEFEGKHIKYESCYMFIQALIGIYV